LRSKQHQAGTTPEMFEAPFGVELTVGVTPSFYNILLGAIDEALSSLGESARTKIYSYLEDSGIKKHEIPFRIDDFQSALEKLFGLGARHLEILFIKNLHAKTKTVYKWDLPPWAVPELTFQQYLRIAKKNFEDHNRNRK
jgi:hypothetical protein